MKKLWISSKLTHGKITWFSRNTIWGSRSFHMARSPKVWAEDIIQCSTIIVNMCFGVRISKILIYFGFRYFLFTLGKLYLFKFQNFRVCFTLIFFQEGTCHYSIFVMNTCHILLAIIYNPESGAVSRITFESKLVMNS